MRQGSQTLGRAGRYLRGWDDILQDSILCLILNTIIPDNHGIVLVTPEPLGSAPQTQ